MINKAFGEDVIKSYIKLRSIELNEFNKTEKLDKSNLSVTGKEKIL